MWIRLFLVRCGIFRGSVGHNSNNSAMNSRTLMPLRSVSNLGTGSVARCDGARVRGLVAALQGRSMTTGKDPASSWMDEIIDQNKKWANNKRGEPPECLAPRWQAAHGLLCKNESGERTGSWEKCFESCCVFRCQHQSRNLKSLTAPHGSPLGSEAPGVLQEPRHEPGLFLLLYCQDLDHLPKVNTEPFRILRVHEEGNGLSPRRREGTAPQELASVPDVTRARQKPDVLWIGCSDARVPANTIMSATP